MKEDLYQPSLQDETFQEAQSYDIRKLFYVAFFGGMIPLVVLGSRNALEFKINKRIIYLLAALGGILLLVKVGLAVGWYHKLIEINPRAIRLIARGDSVIIYLLFYWLMKTRFQQHIVTGGTIKPLLKDALIWIGIGIVIELALILGGVMLFK